METVRFIFLGLVLLVVIIWQGKDFSMNTYRVSYVYAGRKLLTIDTFSKDRSSATREALTLLRKRPNLSSNKSVYVWVSTELIIEQLSLVH